MRRHLPLPLDFGRPDPRRLGSSRPRPGPRGSGGLGRGLRGLGLGLRLGVGIGLLGLSALGVAAQEPLLSEPAPVPDSLASAISLRRLFSEAVQAEERGRTEEALQLFRQVAEQAGDEPEVMTRMAACLAGLQRFEESRALARRAIQLDSTSAEAHWIEGVTLVHLGRESEAIEPLRRAAAIAPAVRTLDLLAATLERTGRDEELVEVLGQLARLHADPFRMRRAAVLERLGRLEEAIDQYRDIVDEDPSRDDAAERLARLLADLGRQEDLIALRRRRAEVFIEDRDLRRSLIASLIQAGRFEEAEAEIERMRSADPDDPFVELQLGMVEYRRGDSRAGMAHVDAAWRLAPHSPPVVRWRMRLQLAEGMLDSALASARRLRALRPADIEATRVEALAWVDKERADEALPVLAEWAELDRRAIEPLVVTAGLHREAGNWQAGLEAIRGALARAPADTALILEYATFLDRAGHPAQADSVAAALLASRPDDPILLNFVGYMLVERGVELDRAEALIRRALTLRPEEPAFLDSLGWLWYKRGRLDEAQRWLQAAIDKGGGHAEIFAHLAQVHIEGGKPELAEREVRLGLRLAPRDRTLRALLERLERN